MMPNAMNTRLKRMTKMEYCLNDEIREKLTKQAHFLLLQQPVSIPKRPATRAMVAKIIVIMKAMFPIGLSVSDPRNLS